MYLSYTYYKISLLSLFLFLFVQLQAQNTERSYELARVGWNVKSQEIKHTGYTTSFNSNWQIPNWVAYEHTKEKAEGTVARPKMPFLPDPDAKGMKAEHRDYSNSGYSRGHMAPAGDMKWSEEAMYESFYLSNICPQKAELNDGAWKRLEGRVRALAKEGSVYICCGPIVNESPKRIGQHKVAVPNQFFKALCMRRKGKWQAIAFLFPNSDCKGSMFDYAISVNELEQITGYDFFYNLPDEIEFVVETQCRMKDWQ